MSFIPYLVHRSLPPVHMFSEMNPLRKLLCSVLILFS